SYYAYGNTSGIVSVTGMLGYPHSCSITDSYVNAKFQALNLSTNYIAGLMGYTSTSNSITRCYVVDSLITSLSTTVKNYYYVQAATAVTLTNVYADSTIGYALGFSTASGLMSTSQMQVQGNYTGWDYSNTWGLKTNYNGNYPFLKWAFIPSILNPISTYYAMGDNLSVITNSFLTDSNNVYINYGHGYIFKSLMIGDTSTFVLDSASNSATIKIANVSSGVTVISPVFVILPTKALVLTGASLSGQNVTLTMVSKNVNLVNIYVGADTLNMNLMTWELLNHYSLTTNTFILTLPKYYANPYFKIVEIKDTTTNDYTPFTLVNSYSVVQNPSLICYTFGYNGLGGVWRRDQGCGTVSNMPIEIGSSVVSISALGVPTVTFSGNSYGDPTLCQNYYPNDFYSGTLAPTGLPTHTSGFSATSISSPVTVNSRQYWWASNKLYMKDLINNITTTVYTNTTIGTTFDSTAGIAQSGGFLLFASGVNNGYPLVLIFNTLLVPNTNILPLYSIVQSTGGLSFYSNNFRGIYPKAIISLYPPEGR
ncbi:MAG: hypothetical protein ACYDBV_11135, partial [Nitrospiria bacterium]